MNDISVIRASKEKAKRNRDNWKARCERMESVVEAAREVDLAWAMTEMAMRDYHEQVNEYGGDHPTVGPLKAAYRQQNVEEHRAVDELHAALAALDKEAS